jgi:hypothetical protein
MAGSISAALKRAYSAREGSLSMIAGALLSAIKYEITFIPLIKSLLNSATSKKIKHPHAKNNVAVLPIHIIESNFTLKERMEKSFGMGSFLSFVRVINCCEFCRYYSDE